MKFKTMMPVFLAIFFLAVAQNCGDAAQDLIEDLTTTCGNNAVESGEECDDGNTSSYDGCDSKCKDEFTFCGNGVVDLAWEQCDDGNQVSGDACDSSCQDEVAPTAPSIPLYEGMITNGYLYSGSFSIDYTFVPTTGAVQAGITYEVYFMDASENDGSMGGLANIDVNATGSVSGALLTNIGAAYNTPQLITSQSAGETITLSVTGADANGGSFLIFMAEQTGNCGNNSVDAGESCDDGNTVDGDGCDQYCQIELASVVGSYSSTYDAATGSTCAFDYTDDWTDAANPVDYYKEKSLVIDDNGFVTSSEAIYSDQRCTTRVSHVTHVGNYVAGFFVGPYPTVETYSDAYDANDNLLVSITTNNAWQMDGRTLDFTVSSLTVSFSQADVDSINTAGAPAVCGYGYDWAPGTTYGVPDAACHSAIETATGGGLGPSPGFTLYSIFTLYGNNNDLYIGHEDSVNNGTSSATRPVLWNGYGLDYRLP